MNVTLIGATGLIGAACLELLARQPATRVTVIARRALSNAGAALRVHAVPDFANLASARAAFVADAVICALGTTLKAAGSRDAFYRVDHDFVVESARLAADAKAPHFLVVSALGADPGSRVFYNRVKGEMERDVSALPILRVTIVRPSLLLGDRAERRTFEQIAKLFAPLVWGRSRPVHGRDVARVLIHEAAQRTAGRRIIESEEIRAIAARLG